MLNSIQFAVVQRRPERPTPDQVKRAFRSFQNLTDADAVRLATDARGILMRHLGQDVARALQSAFQNEGIHAAIVAESDLPRLTEERPLHRAEIWPQALRVYDPFGRTTTHAWTDVTLIAAGAARHYEINKSQTDLLRRQACAGPGTRSKPADSSTQTIDPESRWLLDLVLVEKSIRYQFDAARFSFSHVIDKPGLATEEKFIWLVREICRSCPHAILNHGARQLADGAATVPEYANRQLLTDEMVWLLWRTRQP